MALEAMQDKTYRIRKNKKSEILQGRIKAEHRVNVKVDVDALINGLNRQKTRGEESALTILTGVT
jgi:hypothetical protein